MFDETSKRNLAKRDYHKSLKWYLRANWFSGFDGINCYSDISSELCGSVWKMFGF